MIFKPTQSVFTKKKVSLHTTNLKSKNIIYSIELHKMRENKIKQGKSKPL